MLLRYFKERREDGDVARLVFFPLHDVVQMPREVALQVVDDVRREDLDAVLVRVRLGLRVHGHVEAEDARVLVVALLRHDGRPEHVLLVDGTDRRGRDGDRRPLLARAVFPRIPQELEQRLERPQRRGLHGHALGLGGQRVREARDVLHHLLLQVVHVVVGVDDQDARPRHDLGELRVARNLEADGALERFVFYEVRLDARFSRRRRRQERPGGRHDRAVLRAEHHRVAGVEAAVHEDDVERRAQTLDDLHLEHGTLQVVAEHELLREPLLGQRQHHPQQVRHALAGDRGRRDDRDRRAGIVVVPVQRHV
mmetsp:Transcript_7437/g.23393  ORF Transcript_7437/g.23393 Transcript_7437/m.23393 type:complete len:310 (+) Transcript_7437:406-1335(+)